MRRWNVSVLAGAWCLATLLGAGCCDGYGDEDGYDPGPIAPPTYDSSGKWQYYITDDSGSEHDDGVLTITQTANALSGTTASGATVTGSISGDHVELRVHDALNYATAATADHIEGFWMDQGGSSGHMRAPSA